MTALERAILALYDAQRALDLTVPALGDLWAVLDSQIETLMLWIEKE